MKVRQARLRRLGLEGGRGRKCLAGGGLREETGGEMAGEGGEGGVEEGEGVGGGGRK